MENISLRLQQKLDSGVLLIVAALVAGFTVSTLHYFINLAFLNY